MSEREIRIGDAEREAAVSALGDHYAAGRLTKDEYDERSERAYAARTESDLRPLFADLPAAAHRPRSAVPGPGSGPAPGAGRSAGQDRRAWGWRGVPFVPLLVLAIVLAVVTKFAWPLFVVLGVLWFTGAFRHGRFGCRR